MGLSRATARSPLRTAALLAVAAGVAWLTAAPPARAPAVEADGRTELRFTGAGAQGPIEGVVVVADGRIVDLRVTRTVEGVDRRALTGDAIAARFRGLPTQGPLAIDAVSGATISSRRLREAVERALAHAKETGHAR